MGAEAQARLQAQAPPDSAAGDPAEGADAVEDGGGRGRGPPPGSEAAPQAWPLPVPPCVSAPLP